MFTDLPKAFDTVDYVMLFKKLELYGITGNNQRGKIYRKRPPNKNKFRKSEVMSSSRSMLAPLLCLLYVNDLKVKIKMISMISSLLDPIMLADDTDLF